MIGVAWESLSEEVLRWAYALDVTSWRGALLLALTVLLALLGVTAWRFARSGRPSRHPSEPDRGAPPVLRPVAYSLGPAHGTPAAPPTGTHAMT